MCLSVPRTVLSRVLRAIFGLSLSMTCFAVIVDAAPVILDLSRTHSVEDLRRSGLIITEINGGLHGQAYLFENQEVEILLPAGRRIRQKMVLGIIDTKDGKLTRLKVNGEVMPHDQAVQVMRLFHESFDLPVAPFDAWEARNRGKIRNAEPFSCSANRKSYPIVSLGVDVSMNGLYPWVIGLLISWDGKELWDRNEERAWRELPPPSVAVISLNPPSGLEYDRADAYVRTNFLILCLLVGVGLSLLLVPWLLWRKYRGKS